MKPLLSLIERVVEFTRHISIEEHKYLYLYSSCLFMEYINVPELKNQIYVFNEADSLCPICSYPLSENGECLSCNIFNKNSKEERHFNKIISVGKYFQMNKAEKPAEQSPYNLTWLILNYKIKESYVPFCIELLKKKIQEFLPGKWFSSNEVIICSVPDDDTVVYKKAELLSKGLAEQLKFKTLPLLKKVKETKKQHHVNNLKEKFENVRDAFSIGSLYLNQTKNKTIFLIDDVVSSMASINECSKVLKNAGAKRVYVFSLGRNILQKKEKK
jgi:predicted amidophosphoribosyltransferase